MTLFLNTEVVPEEKNGVVGIGDIKLIGGPSILSSVSDEGRAEIEKLITDLDPFNVYGVKTDVRFVKSEDSKPYGYHVMAGDTDITEFITPNDLSEIELESDDAIEEAKRYQNALERVEKKLYSRMRRGKIKSKLGKKGKSKIPGFGYWFKRD